MDYLSIGSINVPYSWLAFLGAVFISEWMTKKNKDTQLDAYLFLYVVIWKLSYVVFYFDAFVKAPLSVLYFDGGMKGHYLAIFIAVLQLIRKRHTLQLDALWQGFILFIASYHVIFGLLQQNWLVVILAVIALIVIFKNSHVATFFVSLLVFIQYPLQEIWPAIFIAFLILVVVLGRTKQLQQTFAIAVIAFLMGMTLYSPQQNIEATTAMKRIELTATAGDSRTLHNPQKQLTIVNFFATWCPPCKAEMPHLQAFQENLPETVELVGVNLAARDDGEQALQNFLTKYNVTYPILVDEDDQAGKGFGIISIPTTVILNAEGQELHRIVGPLSEATLQQLVERYMQ
ncbi:TlpA disulfide reductase family protein [Solibacillus sp. R5-41]|uniref:TlpA disulfide reductase family protein n=1 Tax=Solibacillus sp. R5-41 TaxID=2048654 RepID=UPI0012FDF9C5|nr:TlpA disulfide reductase family protein [Solibacillus sp. R5-41]